MTREESIYWIAIVAGVVRNHRHGDDPIQQLGPAALAAVTDTGPLGRRMLLHVDAHTWAYAERHRVVNAESSRIASTLHWLLRNFIRRSFLATGHVPPHNFAGALWQSFPDDESHGDAAIAEWDRAVGCPKRRAA